MRRREFFGAIIGGAVAWPRAAPAQMPARIFRLGFLAPTAAPVPEIQALFDALSQLGYREGQNLIVDRRFAAGDDHRLSTLAADLVRTGVDIIACNQAGRHKRRKARRRRSRLSWGAAPKCWPPAWLQACRIQAAM
jgi:hypothetical protein